MSEDTLFRCTACGKVGTVGRCCGRDAREPLNDQARCQELCEKAENARRDAELAKEVQKTLSNEVDRLWDLLCDVAGCAPVMDDPRMSYVEIQIDRPTWDAVRKEAGT